MVWQRPIAVLRTIRDALSAATRALAARYSAFRAHLRGGAWIATLAAIAWPLLWIVRKVWGFLRLIAGWFVSLVRMGPLDLLKRGTAVIISVTGLIALVWVALQIISPPIVITVAKLPEPLEKEFWLNTELPRTLSDQLDRIRAAVRDERSPSFEAVLTPPNIVVKTGDFSLNVQEQILGPLGMLLGRSPGEAHIAITCFHPGCARTSDVECRDIIPAPKPNAEAASAPKQQYLCLRATVDIRRGTVQRRLTPQLTLSNDTYDAEMTKQIGRIAEAVTAVADPATASLYFYRRIQEESAAELFYRRIQNEGATERSVSNDPEVLTELRGEAFKAAAQAESHDTVSACWAHAILARLAIDRREFKLAETYIARAKAIPWWQHLQQFTRPVDCQRLIVLAEMDFARHLAVFGASTFPEHPEDNDEERRVAAYRRIDALVKDAETVAAAWGSTLMGRSAQHRDLKGALLLARAEIGLSWLTVTDQCRLLQGIAPPVEQPGADIDLTPEDTEMENRKAEIRVAIRNVADALALKETLMPLQRLRARTFLHQIAPNKVCLERAVDLGKNLYSNHPNDAQMAGMFATLLERQALAADDGRSTILKQASSIYERMVDIGDDKMDMFALSRLAFINAALVADAGEKSDIVGPNPQILPNVTRAWQRYQRALYPTDIRPNAEFMLAFWGSLLLMSYPPEVLNTGLPRDLAGSDDAHVRSAIVRKAEFEQALQKLFPGVQATKLGELPRLSGIGTRIACICLLTRITSDFESANFYFGKATKWQSRPPTLTSCRHELAPPPSRAPIIRAERSLVKAKEDLSAATTAIEQKIGDVAELQAAAERRKAELAEKEAALKAAETRYQTILEGWKPKFAKLEEADKVCRVPTRGAASGPSPPAGAPARAAPALPAPQAAAPAAPTP